jgi:fatty acid desaturase
MNKKSGLVIYKGKDITPSQNLNICIGIMGMTSMVLTLYFISNTNLLVHHLLGALLFSYIGNTVFGLLHETAHSNFHRNKKVNYIFGNLFAAFFPTAFTFQKRCHLNHHRQNRTDFEMFEAYHESDSKVLKTIMLYCILTGVYWTNPALGSLWLMISPNSLMNGVFSGKNNYKLGRMGGAGMLRHLQKASKKDLFQMRFEALFSLLFQLSLFFVIGISLKAWIICYAGFAIAWSGLQYADHAYSARDIKNGAWNLKVSSFTRYFYLNYHHHLAHHQHPHVPWIHLGKFLDNSPRPSYWKIYLRMWKGLVKIDKDAPEALDPNFEKLIKTELFGDKDLNIS